MRRFLLAASVVALLAAGLGQAGAYFTEQVSIPDNVITVGEVAVSAEPTSGALTVPSLAAGGVARRTLAVANDGSLAANIVVTGAKKAGYTAVYDALTCRVTQGTTVLYDGGLAGLRTEPLRIEPGGSADLTFEIGLPPLADDGLQGDYVRTTLYVDAEQVHP